MKALLKVLFESTAHYAQSTARYESTAVMFEGEDCWNYRFDETKEQKNETEDLIDRWEVTRCNLKKDSNDWEVYKM
ncbi:hypothetical protein Tco_0776724 [Tanacetum coccineum]